MIPDRKTIKKFCGKDTLVEKLGGGQNESVRVGNLVMKPVHEEEKYVWLAECLSQINFGNLHVAVPIKSCAGNYIEDAIGAVRYFDSQFVPDRLEEKLDACRRLNRIISKISKPHGFNSWGNPWTKAQDLAWSHSGISELNLPTEIRVLLNRKTHIDMQNQLVHVDLAGNILFDKNEDPVIIDFTPGFYPKDYSEVLLLIDSIAWYGAPVESLHLLKLAEELGVQLILRALIFRLSVPLFLRKSNPGNSFQANYNGYRSVVEKVIA